MLEQVFLHQKKFSQQLRKESIDVRLAHLAELEKLIVENQAEIISALAQDFKKPEAETLLTEISPLLSEIQYVRKNLHIWMRPTRVKAGFAFMGTRNFIQREPLGVVLIIAPWNYPLNLALSPLIGAIAAGNCAVLKPSEMSRYTSAFLRKYVPKYFREEHIAVIEGGKETTEELLKFPFDHIFFTGSTRVGKVVMEAAAKHLSRVTLELGGKSPAIVDESAHLQQTAEKIVWGKFLNAGQTCVAPDYLLVREHVWPQLKPLLIEAIESFYGPLDQQKNSKSFARMISSGHAQRLETLTKDAMKAGAELVYGGHADPAQSFVGPAILEKVDVHSDVMKEEIFGPVLPVITYKHLPDAIQFINERPKPLALYIFSKSRHNVREILNETSSGGVAINDTILQVGNHHLPFGGVGASGLGNYHGYFGFRAFSHEKAVLRRGWGHFLVRKTYPPYTDAKMNMIKSLLRWNR